MEKTQTPTSPSNDFDQADISLVDILVILAENAKLLIIGPLLVGLCALGFAYLLPQSFESVAVLHAEQATASLMATSAVLDPVAITLGLGKGESAEEARRELRQSIKTSVGRNDKLLTLTVSAPTPQQAQAKANVVLDQTYRQSRPKGMARTRIEVQLAEAQGRFKNAEKAATSLLKRLESSDVSVAGGSDLARGYADLLTASAAAQKQISEFEVLLEGVSEAMLMEAPTLPEKASQPRKALWAISATLVTGIVLLLFVFMRQALRSVGVDAGGADKLARIRRALGVK